MEWDEQLKVGNRSRYADILQKSHSYFSVIPGFSRYIFKKEDKESIAII